MRASFFVSLRMPRTKGFDLFWKLASGRSKDSTGCLTKFLISFLDPEYGMHGKLATFVKLPSVKPSVDLHVRVRAWRPSWWLVKDSKQGYTCLLYISQHRSGSILRHRTSLLHMWHVSIMRHEISPGCLRAARWAYRNRKQDDGVAADGMEDVVFFYFALLPRRIDDPVPWSIRPAAWRSCNVHKKDSLIKKEKNSNYMLKVLLKSFQPSTTKPGNIGHPTIKNGQIWPLRWFQR